MIPIMKPYIHKTLKNKYLREIDTNRFYSNFGPLSFKFKENIKKHFNFNDEVELFSSATAALICVLSSLKKNKNYVLLPSWTFVATAQAVIASGFTPYFVDIDKETQDVSVTSLESIPKKVLFNSVALLIVSPFGKPVDYKKYFDFSKKNKLQLIYDCAAGFDAFEPSSKVISILSLHATKVLPAGEGGVLFSSDNKILDKARAYSNYGFSNQRRSKSFGVNLKLSEYHCANALSSLDQWDVIRKKYFKVALRYKKMLTNNSFTFLEGWGDSWISATCVLIINSKINKVRLIEIFKKNNIEFRDWWAHGCHKEPIFKRFDKTDLVNTNEIACKTIGIPFYIDLKLNEQKKIINLINSI